MTHLFYTNQQKANYSRSTGQLKKNPAVNNSKAHALRTLKEFLEPTQKVEAKGVFLVWTFLLGLGFSLGLKSLVLLVLNSNWDFRIKCYLF